jgi:hypothetical protein
MVKDGEYWNWVGVAKAEGEAAPTSATKGSSGYKVPDREWETREERNARQVMIVRQSSISNAIALLPKAEFTTILDIAGKFEAWVFRKDDAPQSAESDVDVD